MEVKLSETFRFRGIPNRRNRNRGKYTRQSCEKSEIASQHHSGEYRNLFISKPSGCRIESGMTSLGFFARSSYLPFFQAVFGRLELDPACPRLDERMVKIVYSEKSVVKSPTTSRYLSGGWLEENSCLFRGGLPGGPGQQPGGMAGRGPGNNPMGRRSHGSCPERRMALSENRPGWLMGTFVRTAFPEISAFSQRDAPQPFSNGISIALFLPEQDRVRSFRCGHGYVDSRIHSNLQLGVGVRDGDDHPFLEMKMNRGTPPVFVKIVSAALINAGATGRGPLLGRLP